MDSPTLLKMFNLRKLSWKSSTVGESKTPMAASEVESFQLEIANAEEREAYVKAKLDHVDGLLRSAHLAGYLFARMRWTELPGEPPIIDDAEVDDWLPQFVVLNNSCIFFYQRSTDMSPQDSIMFSDIVEVGNLPSFSRGDEDIFHGFFILTSRGSRSECANPSKVVVDAWLALLVQMGCRLRSAAPQEATTESVN
ncbi:uncharacterized protein LOC144701255 [Wolffia australiana]